MQINPELEQDKGYTFKEILYVLKKHTKMYLSLYTF